MLPLRREVRSDICRLSKAACVSRQIRLPFCSLKKMNPAKKPASGAAAFTSITAEMPFGNVNSAEVARQSQFSYEQDFPSLNVNRGSISNKRRTMIDSRLNQRQETVESSELQGIVNIASLREGSSFPSHFGKEMVGNFHNSTSGLSKSKNVIGIENSDYTKDDIGSSRIDSGVEPRCQSVDSSELEGIGNIASLQEEHSLPSRFGKKAKTIYGQKSPSGKSKSKVGTKNSDWYEGSPQVERFNICLPRSRGFESQEMPQEILRPGMVLLKSYISLRDQINMVKTCQKLGEGPGGFYRPGYKDGAKLSLHMMCLGLNWDPQTRKYDKRHPVDDCELPDIPHDFRLLVERAIQDAHCLIKKDSDIVNPEDVLPSVSPNICIVNFYTKYGKLGLHQDRDESKESLQKGLPVVSLSIGDSAEFLYGDQRDVDQAEKVLLDSGDILIFGGESRMLFHGVPSIIPFSAPEALLAKTGLRHGRLNLTFRQF